MIFHKELGKDLFKAKRDGKSYLIVIDYFSKFFEIFELTSTTEDAVIRYIKVLFSIYGRCDVMRSDGGPQLQI